MTASKSAAKTASRIAPTIPQKHAETTATPASTRPDAQRPALERVLHDALDAVEGVDLGSQMRSSAPGDATIYAFVTPEGKSDGQSAPAPSDLARTSAPMKPQSEKAHAFAALHERADAFVMAAPWDLGSARMAAGQGFEALELTPRTLSISYGMRGGALDVTADMLLDAARAISAGTDLPLTVDLGDTVPDAPEDVASLVTAIIDAGAVGVTLSDTTKSDALWPILSDTAARQRIAAARDAADAFDIPVTLTARTEIVSSGEGEADEAATRLRRLQSVGADVLDIPGLHAIEELEMVRKETLRPLSLPLRKGGPQPMDKMKVSALAKAGVKRISADDSMVLLAYGAVLNAGQSVLDRGAIGATLPAEMKYATVLAAMQAGRERVKEQ